MPYNGVPMTNESVVAELLGLVEKWRKKACDDNRRTGKRVVYGACAEDLETLIYPCKFCRKSIDDCGTFTSQEMLPKMQRN